MVLAVRVAWQLGRLFVRKATRPSWLARVGHTANGTPLLSPPFATFAHGHKKLAKTRGVGGDELLEVNGQSSYEALKELRRWHKVGGARSFFRENTNFVAENGRGDILFRHPVGH